MAIWNIDGAHTDVNFSVKHMMVSKVRGSFANIEGTVNGDPMNLTDASISLNIDVNSINTNQNDRDNHLLSEDFFHVEKFPSITFESTDIVETKQDEYDVTGDLSVRGITKKATFQVTRTGSGTFPDGTQVVGFEASTSISRKEFGLTWNQALETGGVLVGDDIKITVDVQVKPE